MMAGPEKEFLIRVAADIRSAAANLQKLAGEFENVGSAGGGAGQEGLNQTAKAADRAEKSAGDLTETVIRFAAAVGAFRAARQFVEVNLQFQAMEATLTAATGDAAAAGAEYAFLVEQANRLGLSISALARPYAQLLAASKGTSLEGQATRDIFVSLSEAISVLKLTAPESERALRAIQQIMSKGTVSAEELRLQLGDVMPGAMQIAARAMGVTTEEFQKMLAAGEVMSNEFLPRFAQEISTTFAPGLTQSIGSLAAEINRLKNNLFELATGLGEGGVTQLMTDLANGVNTAIDAIRELIRTGNLLNNKTLKQLAQDYRSSKEGGAKPVTSFILEGVNTPPPASAPSGPSAEEVDKANTAAERLTETLRMQADVLKLGEFAAIDYRRAHGDLKNATQQEMNAVYESIFALADVRDQIEKNKEVEKRNAEIMRERNKLMEEGTRITEAMRTPTEAFGAELQRLNTLWQEGAINLETYERGVAQAQKEMEALIGKMKTMDESAAEFARSMEGSFSNLFFDVMDGNFKNMEENFSRTLKRMLANLIASQLIGYITGAAGGSAGATGSGTGSGGAGGGSPSTTAARSRGTGITRSEGVAPSQEAGFSGGNVTVLIENKGTPTQAKEGRAQLDPRGLVVSVVLDDLHRGGPIATNLESTYKVRRKS